MKAKVPRFVIAGLSGDSGKTIVSLSLLAGLRQKGLTVSAFKKGPDYIDPAWLSQSAGSVCRNLDTFLVEAEDVVSTFVNGAVNSDIAVIEGNRGLFDGHDVAGTHSTAALARLLDSPVILVVNATKATRTIAAIVKGCQTLDPDVNIAGVVLNRVGGRRHVRIITEAIATYCNLPVIGAIPKLGDDASLIPGRHLGLVTPAEYESENDYRTKLVEIAEKYLDIDRLLKIAGDVPSLICEESAMHEEKKSEVRIGYFRDSSFTFYYPENLEALANCGAELVPVSSVDDSNLPDLDGLYIGGGFPETHADQLTKNRSMMDSVKQASEDGLPIYAECGGLIYLSRSLEWNGQRHDMSGVFPIDLTMSRKPVGHGYSKFVVETPNPFFETGETIKGHEFHYSGPIAETGDIAGCMKMTVGTGLGNKQDGLLSGSTLALYTHVHAHSVKSWSARFVSAAAGYRRQRETGFAGEGLSGNQDDVDSPGDSGYVC